MRQVTAQEKYKAVNEGMMAEAEFIRQMKLAFPQFLSPANGYNDTVQILKNYGMLTEIKKEQDDTSKYSDDSLRRSIDIELEAMGIKSEGEVAREDIEKAKKKAIKNLKKDPLHYYNLMSGESSKVDKHDGYKETKRGKLEKDTFNDMKKATLKEDVEKELGASNGEISDLVKNEKHIKDKLDKAGKKYSKSYSKDKHGQKIVVFKLKENLNEGTRALVGFLSGDRLTTTYNHYDGYPSNLGRGLEAHYNNDDLAKDIAMKGYITGMDADTGEISQTHQDPPKKIVLDDDAEERAREIAEEIDGMGADYGYIWDDESNQWVTIKNTGIRSMIDQMMDKLSMMNVYSGDKMNEADPIPTEPGVPGQRASNHDRKMAMRNIIDFLTKSGHPDTGYKVSNDDAISFIKTHKDDIFSGDIDHSDINDVWSNYDEFESVNRDSVDEKRIRVRKEGLDADFAPSPNSDVMDANAEEYDVATAFKKAKVDMSKPVAVIHSYGAAYYASEDTDVMSAEAAIKKLEAERQDRSKQYTDDGEKVPEDHHGYEFENYSVLEEEMPEGHEYKFAYFQTGDATYAITQEKSGVSEKKGKDHDGDGDVDTDDYMAAKDKAIKKAMGKDVDEALDSLIAEDSKTMGKRDLAPHYAAAAKAVGFSDEQTKKAFGLVSRFMDKRAKGRRVKFINYGWAGYEDLYKKLADILNKADGGGWEVKDDGSWYGDGSGWQVVKTYPFDNINENAGDDEHMVHELIGDLFAPGNARLHFEMPVKKIASYLKKYRGSITSQAVKAAMDTYDKLAADGTLQKDYDNDNGFLLPEHIAILKKAFGLIGLYNDVDELAVDRKGNPKIDSKPSRFKGRDKSRIRGLKEGRGDMDIIKGIIEDRAAESGFEEREEAAEVIAGIADEYMLSLKVIQAYLDSDGPVNPFDVNEKNETLKEAVKAIITKSLEEEMVNEAATQELARIADEYDSFEGLKPAVIALENIVTEIESFYDKTRAKIQKIYDDLGEVKNEEGLKVGAFITPSIENAFKKDLRPITKAQFHGGLKMAQVKRISQDDVDRGYVQQEAPKQTVYSPVNEKKK